MIEANAYTELHTHSYFSLLDGASSPEELIQQAADLGMQALALTDHDAIYGAPRLVRAAHEAGIHPILGAELTLHDGSHLTLLAQEETGWHNLCALITFARHNAVKGEAALPEGILPEYTAGLIALSGCQRGGIAASLLTKNRVRALELAQHYLDLFGREHFWIELQNHLLPEDKRLNDDLTRLAKHIGIGVVATNNVHYATRDRQQIQDVLVCIGHNTTLDDTPHLRPNSEYYLKSALELAPLFARTPEALSNTQHITAMCQFELRYGLQELPSFPMPGGMNADAYLRELCQKTIKGSYIPSDLQAQLDYELRIIHESGLSNYFLIVWDIVRFAHENGILCQGRGSAANSLVAYLLGISPINPLRHDLVFERFLSAERQVVPDIDIDFDAARREEVIQYVYGRYGLEHAAMACTFVTFRARSAIRDVGKAMGLPPDLLDHVTTTLDVQNAMHLPESSSLQDVLGTQVEMHTWQQVFDLCEQLDGLPRHLGIHNGGMIITGAPLSQRVPTEPATMENRFVTQWDKDALEDIGLVKIDILGLRMLSAVADAVEIVTHLTGNPPDLNALTFDDPQVYDMICAADTVGVFQVESRAQAQVLPRLQPRCFNDLIVSISLIRPGPVQGNMVHPYLRRRLGQEEITYFHPLLEAALRETLGVILFQEQVIKVARDLAGFSAGQGELLRRALGAKHPGESVERFRHTFMAGAAAKGVDADTAGRVFDKLRAFGGYSFPQSHAAAFAVLVYRSAWLKYYHPAAFYTSLLNNQPMGFWSPAVIVKDAQRHGIEVQRVDVNDSQPRCIVIGKRIRLGFNYVRELSIQAGERLVAARGSTPFINLEDFCRRTRLPRRMVENLIAAGAMDSWARARRDLFWELGMLPAMTGLDLIIPSEAVILPPLSEHEQVGMEMAMTGLTTGDHPMQIFRQRLQQRNILSSADLHLALAGNQVKVSGLLVVHQSPPTAKGYRFLTLEDEFGFINVIVRPKVYAQFRRIVREQPLLLVVGEVQHEGAVTNVIAVRIHSLSGFLTGLGYSS
jgi:error-prone DNA polymerase